MSTIQPVTTAMDTTPNQRLRALLDEFNYTQEEVSKLIGRDFTTINKYVSPSAPREIPEAILLLMQSRIGFSAKYITTGKGPRMVKAELIASADLPLITPSVRTQFAKGYAVPTQRIYGRSEEEVAGWVVLEVALRDQMGEQLKPGSKVLARPLSESEWDTITGVVAFVTAASVDIKRITSNTLPINDTLTMVADSPKGGSYTVTRSMIRALYSLQTLIESQIE